MNHDNLAQIPVNAVLIGLFTEALNTVTTPGHKYPEYITINGGTAANTTSRTYKFKSIDVRKYLEGLSRMIETTLHNFVPDESTLLTNIQVPYKIGDNQLNIALPNTQSEDMNPKAHQNENETIDDAVGILDEPENSFEPAEIQTELKSQVGTQNKILEGGAKLYNKKPRYRKISIKKLK